MAKSYAIGRSVMFQAHSQNSQLGNLPAELLEGLRAGDDPRVVPFDAVVQLEQDQVADHGRLS